jgi:universal stress protein E
MSWNRILFAVASPGAIETSPGVADKALQVATALGAELEIFHCVNDPEIARPGRFASRGPELDVQEIVEQRHQQLERGAERLRGRGIRVRTSVRWDRPVFEGIVRQVLRHKADLLIAQAPHGGGSVRSALMPTDFKLIEACPCPLLLIKTAQPYSAPRIVAAVDPAHPRAKPAALDDAILQVAGVLASSLPAELIVFHARAPWDVIARAQMALESAAKVEGLDAESRYRERIADRVRELAEDHGICADRTRLLEGLADQLLPAFARSEHADIVAMGAVSRSLIKRILIGHTAERVLDALDCDVLIVKSPGFVSPVRVQSRHLIEPRDAQSGRYVF